MSGAQNTTRNVLRRHDSKSEEGAMDGIWAVEIDDLSSEVGAVSEQNIKLIAVRVRIQHCDQFVVLLVAGAAGRGVSLVPC